MRAGLAHVSPDVSNTGVLVGGIDFALPKVFVVGGEDEVNNTQLGLTVTESWNVEVVAATPFSHDIEILGGTKLASTTDSDFFADSRFGGRSTVS